VGFQVDDVRWGPYYSRRACFWYHFLPCFLFEQVMSSAPPNRLKDAEYPLHQADVSESSQHAQNKTSISEAEVAAIRADKLLAIKNSVEAGDYDSDEVLREALGRMIDSVKKQDFSES
jgi:hypothetical protein